MKTVSPSASSATPRPIWATCAPTPTGDQGDADVAFVNGGGIRVSIPAGDITLGDILQVHPFGNALCVVEATGQQILDALEWGARNVPAENGGFLRSPA